MQGDGDGAYVADVTGRTIRLPIGSSDAAMAPYHVDRSKLFVIERFDTVEYIDADRIAARHRIHPLSLSVRLQRGGRTT